MQFLWKDLGLLLLYIEPLEIIDAESRIWSIKTEKELTDTESAKIHHVQIPDKNIWAIFLFCQQGR